MLKRVVVLAGTFGTMMALAAVGCSSSSNDVTGGGNEDSGTEGDGSTGFGKDGGTKIDGSVVTTDGGKDSGVVVTHDDGGTTTASDAGIVVDSGTTIHGLDGGVVDAGTVVEVDGGVSGSCFMNDSAQQLNFTGILVHQNRCTPTQITEFNTACLGATATTLACNAVVAADGDCSACLFGGNVDGGLGAAPALLPVGGNEQVNVSGCLAGLSTAPVDCKNLYQEMTFCADTTCSTCATDNDDSACQTFSQTDPSSACEQSFALDGTCVNEVESTVSAGDAANKCAFGATDFTTAYTEVATTICGL